MFGPNSEAVSFTRDCEAIMVPVGDRVTIEQGTIGIITQALGGSFTVYIEGNLYLIPGAHADALGKEPMTPPSLPENATDADVRDLVWSQLKTCYDPEIPINIVDLGLIYDCELQSLSGEQRRVHIKMTLTAPGCGMGEVLVEDVRCKVELIPTVGDVDVELVFDPPWNQSMMSYEARLETGML